MMDGYSSGYLWEEGHEGNFKSHDSGLSFSGDFDSKQSLKHLYVPLYI